MPIFPYLSLYLLAFSTSETVCLRKEKVERKRLASTKTEGNWPYWIQGSHAPFNSRRTMERKEESCPSGMRSRVGDCGFTSLGRASLVSQSPFFLLFFLFNLLSYRKITPFPERRDKGKSTKEAHTRQKVPTWIWSRRRKKVIDERKYPVGGSSTSLRGCSIPASGIPCCGSDSCSLGKLLS